MALWPPHFPAHFGTSALMMENASCTWTQLVWMGTSWARHTRFYLGLMSFRKLLMDVDTPPAIIFPLSHPAGLVGSSATSWLSVSERGGVGAWLSVLQRGGVGARNWEPFKQHRLIPQEKDGRQTKKKPLQPLLAFHRTRCGWCTADVFALDMKNDIAGEDSIVSVVRHKLRRNNELR